MIREATIDDLPVLERMAVKFFDESGYSERFAFDENSMRATFIRLIQLGSVLTDGESGMIGFLVFPHYFNINEIVAQELFWWVAKEKRGTRLGVELLDRAEGKAKKLGAKSMIMLSIDDLEGDKIGKMYQKRGYRKNEQLYIRSL